MPTGKSLKTLKFSKTNSVGAFIGRSIPWLGYAETRPCFKMVAHTLRPAVPSFVLLLKLEASNEQ